MVTFMKEYGKKIKGMDKEFTIITMEKCIEEITIWVKEMDLVSSIIRMEIDMKGNGKMGTFMVLVHITIV